MSNSTGGSSATSLLEPVTSVATAEITVPDSPAGLWISASRPITATRGTWRHVSADLASWVAPPVTIRFV